MNPKIKKIIIFAFIAAILIFAYSFLAKKKGEDANLATTGVVNPSPITPATSGALGSNPLAATDFLSVLLNVKSIRLDDTIFSDPAFLSLHDSSIVLVPDGTEGRPNPFAPIGTDIGPAPVSTPAPTIDTTAPTPPAMPVN